MRNAIFGLLVLATVSSLAFARPVPSLSYAQLMSESDLVVIVHAVSTRDAHDNDPIVPVKLLEDRLAPIVTTFEVLTVLKGKHDSKTLELCHYKYKPNAEQVGNGPMLVWFPARADDLVTHSDRHGTWKHRVPNDFVLFLKRDTKGRLTFVTGQFDAEPSVRQIHDPLPPSMRPDP